MSITQTIDIPASHRLTIDVPREVPEGKTILTFTPASADQRSEAPLHPCPLCAGNIDPETGNPRYNAETIAGMQEVEDMISGKVPTKWYNSLEEMLVDLDSDD